MYLRLFYPNLRTRYLIYFGMVFVVLFYTSSLLVEAINCTPRQEKTWNETSLSKRCGRDLILGYFMAALNVVSDFYLLAIQFPVVWKLQMPLRRKVGVCAMFMTGLLYVFCCPALFNPSKLMVHTRACICSAIYTYFRVHAALSLDVLWNITPIMITS